MRKIIYVEKQKKKEEWILKLENLLAFIVITLLCITLVIMNKGNKKLQQLDKYTYIDQEEQFEERNLSVKEMLWEYIDTLPIPEETQDVVIEETSNLEENVQNQVNAERKEEQITNNKVTVQTFNVSAYCACNECCQKTDGITASGNLAKQWYTIAAGSKYKIGTKIYIPALKDTPSEGWFVVEDRGGAIANDCLDIYLNSHTDALEFGRHNYECYVYEK